MNDLFGVAHLDFVKLFDVQQQQQQQQFLLGRREKGREGCLYRMISVNFIKQSPTADEIMNTDSERDEIMQEESDEMSTDISYSPDEGSDTQSIVMSDVEENNKKGIDIMSSSLAAALDCAKISDRNVTYLLAAVIDALELDPNNYNISRSADQKSAVKFGKASRQLHP